MLYCIILSKYYVQYTRGCFHLCVFTCDVFALGNLKRRFCNPCFHNPFVLGLMSTHMSAANI
jgi:hypothetical protein